MTWLWMLIWNKINLNEMWSKLRRNKVSIFGLISLHVLISLHHRIPGSKIVLWRSTKARRCVSYGLSHYRVHQRHASKGDQASPTDKRLSQLLLLLCSGFARSHQQVAILATTVIFWDLSRPAINKLEKSY